jgi:N-acetyl-anhydromuramyl-L-alanine amidase AmpD
MFRFGIKQMSIMISLWLLSSSAFAQLAISNAYYSPRNKERDVRAKTTLLILHTTEAVSSSALRKLSDMGECHFCVDEAGRIYRIIDHRRVAFHAGRSMWNGKQEVDNFSIGIEVCGSHNKPLSSAQTKSLTALIVEVKRIYKLSDNQVLAHSQVAYGAPNKWQPRDHRGRKRCGMQFGMPSVRSKLGLKSRPAKDPDVAARRLVIADPALNEVLYSRMNAFTAPSPQDYEPRQSTSVLAKQQQPVVSVFTKKATTRSSTSGYQTIGIQGRAQEIADRAVLLSSTIYVYPHGRYILGNQLTPEAILKLPYGTKVLLDYSIAGTVSSQRSPITICGSRWKLGTTYYLINGALIPGNMVDDGKIPSGTTIFAKND